MEVVCLCKKFNFTADLAYADYKISDYKKRSGMLHCFCKSKSDATSQSIAAEYVYTDKTTKK